MTTTISGAPTALPSTLRVGIARGGVELREFFRQRAAVVFVFALPAVLFALLGSIFHHSGLPFGVTQSQLFTGGMVAAGWCRRPF